MSLRNRPRPKKPLVLRPKRSRAEIAENAETALRALYPEARRNPALFAKLVLRDEETGRRIRLAAHHIEWHDLMDRSDRLVIWSHVESGKTQQVSIARVLYEIGRNPNIRVVILSNTKGQAKKIVQTIKRYIESSEDLHTIFPELRPGEIWQESAISVKRGIAAKDPTVQAAGYGAAILGARIDLLIADDILDLENTSTHDQREKLWTWLQANVVGRLTKNARQWVVGTAFHPQDAIHRYSAMPGFTSRKFPVMNPRTGEPHWPEAWPRERIERRRGELIPIEFARQMMCEARDDKAARFQWAWIEQCLLRGNGRSMAAALAQTPAGYGIYTGVDLQVSPKDASDLACLFTIALHPNQDREVLSIESGRWGGPGTLMRMVETHRRFNSTFMVENNAAQDFIIQFATATTAIPVLPFTTGRNKAHPEFGIEALATEMMNKKWIIPNHDGVMHPEVQEWVNEALYYNPQAHTGDRLMASWFAREAANRANIKAEVGRLNLTRR